MFGNNKSGDLLYQKSKSYIKNFVRIVRYKKHDRIKKCNKRNEDILG